MTEQRWLSLDMISTVLRLPKSYIRTLTTQGYLVTIGKGDKRRWLDPTPEYAEKLYLAAVLHGEVGFVPPDVSTLGLMTIREVAVICGWATDYARLYMQRHPEVPRLRINTRNHLFSVTAVREILWRRQGRKLSKQRNPFLVSKLIEFFWRQMKEDELDIPTEAEHEADEKIQKQLAVLARRFDRADAQKDFASKVELAGKVVQILDFARKLGDARPEPNIQPPGHTAPD